jgi:hypothetical protein
MSIQSVSSLSSSSYIQSLHFLFIYNYVLLYPFCDITMERRKNEAHPLFFPLLFSIYKRKRYTKPSSHRFNKSRVRCTEAGTPYDDHGKRCL